MRHGASGFGEGVGHQLAPGERRFDREVCVPAAETDTCGCRTVSGAQHAVAQLGESVSMIVNAPRMRLTLSLPSGPDPVEGSSPRTKAVLREPI